MSPYTKFIADALYEIYKKHRHISVKIESSWGTEKCHWLFQDYLTKNRIQRIGFDPGVFQNLILLYLIHAELYGDFNQPLVLMNSNVNLDPSKLKSQ